MKLLFFFIFIVPILFFEPSLDEVREDFKLATNNRALAIALRDKLAPITKTAPITLVAYKGAVTALTAKYSKENVERKNLFKNGVSLLEYALSKEPDNIEIRCLRLSIQENTPKFLKYKSNIQEDKNFLIAHYKSTKSQAVKKFIKSYVLQSKGFNPDEKQRF